MIAITTMMTLAKAMLWTTPIGVVEGFSPSMIRSFEGFSRLGSWDERRVVGSRPPHATVAEVMAATTMRARGRRAVLVVAAASESSEDGGDTDDVNVDVDNGEAGASVTAPSPGGDGEEVGGVATGVEIEDGETVVAGAVAAADDENAADAPPPSDMRLREIQSELRDQWRVSYEDCFDRDSLTKRLLDARSGIVVGAAVAPASEEEADAVVVDPSSTATTSASASNSSPKDTDVSSSSSPFDRQATLIELRSLRVKELRTRLSERNVRWGDFVEKEDLVRALADVMERASHFSRSGALSPGKVADVSGEVLAAELGESGDGGDDAKTPLLVDVYATWCGPCKMVEPQLASAAQKWGEKVRVAKIDSDKHPAWCSRKKVGGLPTLILFDSVGREVDRVEGALMEEGLVQFVGRHFEV